MVQKKISTLNFPFSFFHDSNRSLASTFIGSDAPRNHTNLIMIQSILFIAAFTATHAHSWADNVGGGSYRGAQGGNDLVKQRYYCPLASLDQCQPDPKHNIMLTADAMRPCRTDFPTPNWGSATAGQPMYVHWAGNGHTSDTQSAGTCVSISIAPFALDPDRSAFRQIASCLPYAHDGGVTDASVRIPSDLAPGQYTVFWMWDFSPFWYSSCTDINVSGGSGGSTPSAAPTAAPATSKTPFPTAAPTAAPTVAPTPATSLRPSNTPSTGQAVDCKGYERPNAQCQALYGSSSYCVSWEADACGRSSCFGAPTPTSAC